MTRTGLFSQTVSTPLKAGKRAGGTPALLKIVGNPFILLCCLGRFFKLGSHGSHPALWQTPDVSHPDALDVRPGRYPHTGRGFFSSLLDTSRPAAAAS
jgi:hypothetical protein